MISCLETISYPERQREVARNDYQYENQYNESHPDALANGGKLGRGTGSSGHGFWLPKCTSVINQINYSNFDTDPSLRAGTAADNEARDKMMARSLYNYEKPYGTNIEFPNYPFQYFVP